MATAATCVSLFNLRHPQDFTSAHPEGEPCLYIIVFGPLGIFLVFRLRFVSRALGFVRARSPPGPRARVWALAEVRGTCSGGSKSQVPSGRHSEHVEPSRPLKTHVQVKKMSGGYNVISGILNVINVIRPYLLGDGKFFPDTDMPDMRPLLTQ